MIFPSAGGPLLRYPETGNEIAQLYAAVRDAKVKSVVCFVLHWNPSLMNTRRLIDRGAIGTPYYVEVDY